MQANWSLVLNQVKLASCPLPSWQGNIAEQASFCLFGISFYISFSRLLQIKSVLFQNSCKSVNRKASHCLKLKVLRCQTHHHSTSFPVLSLYISKHWEWHEKTTKSNDQESKYIYNNPSHVRFTNHSNHTKLATWKETMSEVISNGEVNNVSSLPQLTNKQKVNRVVQLLGGWFFWKSSKQICPISFPCTVHSPPIHFLFMSYSLVVHVLFIPIYVLCIAYSFPLT